jgi:hypothetical protein
MTHIQPRRALQGGGGGGGAGKQSSIVRGYIVFQIRIPTNNPRTVLQLENMGFPMSTIRQEVEKFSV